MQSLEGDSKTHREKATASLAPAASANLPIVLSAPRKKSVTTSSPLASCTAKVGMVHTKSDARKNSFELSVAVCVSALRGHRHTCCVRLCVVHPRTYAVECGLACLCECVRCLRLRACWRVCVSSARQDIGGVGCLMTTPRVSWVHVHMFCFTTPRRDLWLVALSRLRCFPVKFSSRSSWRSLIMLCFFLF